MSREIIKQNNLAETIQGEERQHTQTVWIVEDESHIRDEAQVMLNTIEGISCTKTFASGEDALQQLSKTATPPNIVLLDIRMEGINGLEVLQRIKKLRPETFVIMMTNYADDQYVQKALDRDAAGYVLKDDLWDNFGKYLEEALRGERALSKTIKEKLIKRAFPVSTLHGDYHLTKREQDVLLLSAQGFSKPKIADKLFISNLTVKDHVKHIYHKLGVHNIPQAIAKVFGLERFFKE